MSDKSDKISFIVSERSFEKFGMIAILGTTGAALGYEMNFFFTFWGLYLLKKKFKPKAAGMPFPMKRMGAWMFKKRLAKGGMEDPWGLIKEAVEEGNLKLYPCQTTMDLMGIKLEDLIDIAEEPVGAAAFLEIGDGGRIVSL